jgi:predicted metal-binding membrane protein
LQAYLEHLALLSPMMVSKSPQLGGLILVSAGVYQVTPMKDVCLKHCQTPPFGWDFIMVSFVSAAVGS